MTDVVRKWVETALTAMYKAAGGTSDFPLLCRESENKLSIAGTPIGRITIAVENGDAPFVSIDGSCEMAIGHIDPRNGEELLRQLTSGVVEVDDALPF